MKVKISPLQESADKRERLVEIRKRRNVYVYESKPEDWNGITLFFYHGAGGLHSHFRHQLEYFKDLRYRTVTYDMYGHGCSSSRQRYDYTFDQLCYDALALFDRYALTEENILVGHSYGTSLCTVIYNERSSKVKKLVLISGGGPYALLPNSVSLFCFPSNILMCFKPLLIRLFRKVSLHNKATTKLHDTELLSVDFKILKHIMIGQVWLEGDEEYHSRINCPVLLIVGKHDKFITLSDETAMNDTLPQSVLHILDGGHMLPLECGEHVSNLIQSFISSQSISSHIHEHRDSCHFTAGSGDMEVSTMR